MRVVGAVENRKANSARIRIISFKRKSEYVTDPEELTEAFPPEGLVFAPVLPERFEVDDLIEFQTIQAPYTSKPTDDLFILDKNGGCNFVGYEVLAAPFSVLIDGSSVDIEQIEQSLIRPNSEFYLLINQFLYGPFRNYEDYIQPIKEVFQIPVKGIPLYPAGNKLYLLGRPPGKVKCDVMNYEQLADWLKDQLRNLGASADLQAVKQAIQNYKPTGLDNVRLKRALKALDQILLNQADLKFIAENLPQFKTSYEIALDRVHDEIAAPLLLQSKQLEKDIAALALEKEKAALALEDVLHSLEVTTKQVNNIESEKSRLIEDIKIHALIQPPATAAVVSVTSSPRLDKYEVQSFQAEGELYLSINDFIKVFKKTLIAGNEEMAKASHASLLLLKDYKCLLSGAVKPLLQIAMLTNNAKVILQQVEPDWLKYDSFYENGLKLSWESAQARPDIIHFFILEDINLASPECYAKPLNDILAGIRKTLPGLLGAFPPNLWIFGVPLVVDPDQDFGLPLLKISFKHWGALPTKDEEWEFNQDNPGLKLTPDMLISHDEIAVSSPDDYFINI